MRRHRLSSYLARFFMLVLLLVLLAVMGMFALSNYFSATAFNATNRIELENAIDQASELLIKYNNCEVTFSELRSAVNPIINVGEIFWMLVSPDKQVVTYSEAAVPYFGQSNLADYITVLDDGLVMYKPQGTNNGMTLILGEKTPGGYIIVGKPLRTFYGAASNFRMTMLTWLIPLVVILLLVCIFATRFIARPAIMLTGIASRMAKGERVMLDDDLPGEVGELAHAFNHMSERIASTINALNTEKETMRRILEALSEGILAIDVRGDIIHENTAAVRLLGAAGTPAYDEVMGALKKCLTCPGDMTGKLTREDAVLFYAITHLPKEEERGGTIALIRDVTEQERLERTRHDYVANISHELRTPLANMRGLAEGLRDGLVTEKADRMRYYGMIVDEIKRLSRLVNDLLELSGLQSNPKAFDMETVAPTELMWELYDLNKHLFEQNKQQFTLNIPGEELPEIVTNEDRLSQVMTIFMDNARKFTPEGGSVELGAEPVAGGVRFYVKDTGIGMDEETVRLAFDRFHQAERSHAQKGSGLGLSIAREILQKLGVEVGLRSKVGEGSEFFFILPLKAALPR